MDTYGNIAHVEKVEYEGLAEGDGDTPLVTETRDFSIIYTISNTGDFNLAPEFSLEGCEAEIKKIETEKYRIALTVSGESLATLEDGAALKVKLLLYMAKQKILQSAYEIDMLYVRTGPPAEAPNPGDPLGSDGSSTPGNPPDSVAPSNPNNPSGGDSSNPEEEEPALPENIVYVRGDDATWYAQNKPNAKIGDDKNNSGDEDEPFATIQRAVEEIIERNKHNEGNDVKSRYEIHIDGTLKGGTSDNGMADFSALEKDLTLTIKAISETATLDAGGKSRVIYAKPASGSLNLTLKKLVIKGGKVEDGNGGGICIVNSESTAAVSLESLTITENEAGFGGGVSVVVETGTFTIKGCTISENKAQNGAGIFVDSTATTMENSTISDNNATANGGGFYIAAGTFTMKNSHVIKNKVEKINGGGGGGGGAFNYGATFKMDASSTIKGNTAQGSGGGVYLAHYNDNFIINGGEISGNISESTGGGICVDAGGTLTMTGGTISGNTAGTSSKGGGVYVSSGTFNMKGGSISKNTAQHGGGVYVEGGTLNMTGGTIGGSGTANTATGDGGGVYINENGTVIMSGGKISGNTATKDGGGVYINEDGTFTMSRSSAINENNGAYGGGVHISKGTLTMNDNSTISGNTATGDGGGVYVASNGEFTMSGGEISNNDARGNKTTGIDAGTSGGGGVYVFRDPGAGDDAQGIFTMNGGTITNNTASVSKKGNGVFLSPDGTFRMSGGAKVVANNDVYLNVYSDQNSSIPTITVTGMLTAESPVATITPARYVVGRQVLSGETLDKDVCDKFALSSTGYTIKFSTPYGVIGGSQ